MTVREGVLVLSDGETFEGELIGADTGVATGEVVFNTVMSGYQEVISDPSYRKSLGAFDSAAGRPAAGQAVCPRVVGPERDSPADRATCLGQVALQRSPGRSAR